MNELYLTEDGKIAKYRHQDGSETSIKTWPGGCGGSGRDKWNLFASCSLGCSVGCAMCFLTVKKFPHQRLSAGEVAENVISAIREELVRRPELEHIPFNLSWLGMGEPWFCMDVVRDATFLILEEVSKHVDQIEGVDIGSTFPNIPAKVVPNLFALKDIQHYVRGLGNLTHMPPERTRVRLFYSLHSVDESVRRKLINVPIQENHFFRSLMREFNVNFHYVFLDGINDSVLTTEHLARYMLSLGGQLRVIRYNKCPGSTFSESSNFDRNIKYLHQQLGDKLKVQISPGSEISAACGMFLGKN